MSGRNVEAEIFLEVTERNWGGLAVCVEKKMCIFGGKYAVWVFCLMDRLMEGVMGENEVFYLE